MTKSRQWGKVVAVAAIALLMPRSARSPKPVANKNQAASNRVEKPDHDLPQQESTQHDSVQH